MRKCCGLMWTAGVLLAVAGAARAQESPRALLERAIQAHGGLERLSRVRADRVKVKGTLQLGTRGIPFTAETTVQLPAQYKNVTEMTVEGRAYTLVHVLNGERTLVTLNGQPQKVEEAALAEMRDTLQLDRAIRLAPLLTDRTFDLAPLGEAKVNGKPAVGLKVTAKGRKELHLYFDRDTGLLVKTEHVLEDRSGKQVRQEEFYSDFRDIGGSKRPVRVSAYRDGRKMMDAELVDVKYLDRVDDAEFAIP